MTFAQLVERILDRVLNPLVAFFIGLAVVIFLWGVVKYIKGEGGGEKDKEESRRLMVWGIVALFVAVSVWGLVTVLINTFGLDTSVPPLPLFDSGSGGP